jgi:diguanylate cyclase (GGDEF)-like protein/PAS domain S-box-containing protein
MRNITAATLPVLAVLGSMLQRTRLPPLEEHLAGILRAEQITAVSRLSPMAMTANILSATLVAWAFWRDPASLFVVLWAALLVAASGLGLLQWVRQRARPKPARASRRAIRTAVIYAAVIAVLWSSAPFLLFAGASGQQQLVIATLITGLICGGGFALAAIPQAALTYIGIMMAVGFASLVRTGEPLFLLVAGLLLVYTTMLAFSVVWHARLLAARLLGQDELKRQGSLIALLLSDFEENATDWLWETDAAGRLHHVSPRLAQAIQRPRDELRGASLVSLLATHRSATHGACGRDLEDLQQHLAERSAFRDLVVAFDAAGETRWWSLTGRPVVDDNGAFQGYRGVGTDVTAATVANAKIKHMAQHDALTGLPNRAWFREQTERVLSNLGDEGGAAVVFVNIDRFKGLNEAFGHAFGDALLRAVADRLRERMWDSGMVARLGGDEFAVLQVSQDPVRDAAALAERLVASMAAPFEIGCRRRQRRHRGRTERRDRPGPASQGRRPCPPSRQGERGRHLRLLRARDGP